MAKTMTTRAADPPTSVRCCRCPATCSRPQHTYLLQESGARRGASPSFLVSSALLHHHLAQPRGPAAVSATTEGTLIGALGTTTEVSETTGAVGTRVETAVRNVTPSTTTIGRVLNATTRTFLSGMHATAVKPHDPAAVANGTAPRAPEEVGNATTLVSKVVASKVGRKVAVNKVDRVAVDDRAWATAATSWLFRWFISKGQGQTVRPCTQPPTPRFQNAALL